jgi:hypothetical protein
LADPAADYSCGVASNPTDPGSQPAPTWQEPDPAWQPPTPYGQFSAPAPVKKPGPWKRFRRWAFSNLNLNGRTPPRVQPTIGEWGPQKVPTTKQKKRMRIYVSIALPAAMLACFLLGWYVYFLMTGCYGFGFGCRSS